MKPIRILLFALLCLAGTRTNAQEKFSKVSIQVPADLHLRGELLASLEIDHYYFEQNGRLVSTISASALQKLARSPYAFDILVDDVTKKFVEDSKLFFENAKGGNLPPDPVLPNLFGFESPCTTVANLIPTPSFFSTNGLPPGAMGGYYTYAEMSAKIDQLVTAYPTLIQKINLGNSLEGRPIWAAKISDNVSSDESEPEVLFTALQHAREAIGGTSMIFLMQYLCQNYASNAQVQALVNNREFYIVPCVNPDGYEYNRSIAPSGGGLHRKNRRPNNATNPGVDLNRNYGIDWGNCAGASSSCGSSTASNDTYFGTAAFSEPETQAIRTLVTSRQFVASIDQHCFGPYYSLPFGRPSLHTMSALDQKFYTAIPALMGKYNGMRAGNSPETVNYEVAGGIKDWLLMGDIGLGTKGKIYGMTGEGGGGDFWAPSNQIISLCKGMTFQNIQLALAAGSYYDIQDQSDVAVAALNGSFSFKIRRIGLTDAPVTVSLVRLENVMTVGAPVVVSSLPNYYDTYSGTIPYSLYGTLSAGQRIRFAWKVESGGITTYDTIVKIYNPVTLFQDDMESGVVGTKWTVAGGWNYSTGQFYAGTRSLTESPAGNYTTSSTRTAQMSGTLNLSDATAAYITFWTKHRAENFRDKMQIQVSTNGTTWIPVCSKNTVMEGNADGSTLGNLPALTGIRDDWYQDQVNLSGYLGQSALRVRVSFTSDGDASAYAYELDDGFSIDNVKIIKSTTALQNLLAVKFVNIFGKLTTAGARVDWEAVVDAQHDRFVVERSLDGRNFEVIGEVKGLPPYFFNDPQPAIGNNYYRIRQLDKEGKATYSQVINIVNNPRIKLTVFPNPVSDELRMKVEDNRSNGLRVSIMDMQGRMVYSKDYQTFPVSGMIRVNTQGWLSQVYHLKITNLNGELITQQKFIKQ